MGWAPGDCGILYLDKQGAAYFIAAVYEYHAPNAANPDGNGNPTMEPLFTFILANMDEAQAYESQVRRWSPAGRPEVIEEDLKIKHKGKRIRKVKNHDNIN